MTRKGYIHFLDSYRLLLHSLSEDDQLKTLNNESAVCDADVVDLDGGIVCTAMRNFDGCDKIEYWSWHLDTRSVSDHTTRQTIALGLRI